MRKIAFELLRSAKESRNFSWSFDISWKILIGPDALVSQCEMPASLYFLADMAPVTAMCRKILPPHHVLQAAPPQGTVSLSPRVTNTAGPKPGSAAGGVLQGQQQNCMREEETTGFLALGMHRLLMNY